MTVVEPITVEAIGLSNVRFFRPPSGGREFPWVAFDDITAAMSLPRNLRRTFKADLRNSKWSKDVATVRTSNGTVEIFPHYQAQGLIDAMTQVGRCPADLYWAYAQAGAKALDIITEGCSKDQLLAYLKEAMQAGGGLA